MPGYLEVRQLGSVFNSVLTMERKINCEPIRCITNSHLDFAWPRRCFREGNRHFRRPNGNPLFGEVDVECISGREEVDNLAKTNDSCT